MAKCVIVNTLPLALKEAKPGLIPAVYKIAAAEKGSFTITVIDDAYHKVLIPLSDVRMPPMRIPNPCEEVAEAIVRDYVQSCRGVSSTVEADGSISTPGIFWLPGNLDENEIKTKHKEILAQAFKNTATWFKTLVTLADDEWARSRQYKLIVKLQRIACNYLGLTREWNQDNFAVLSTTCGFCKSNINVEAIVCPNCKEVVNAVEYNKRKAVMAKA